MSDSAPIRKAVIPAAGLGTRMLPITRALPKEMLPILNKPLIQYAVEEAMAAGIEEVILITRTDKPLLERYLNSNPVSDNDRQRHSRQYEAEHARAVSSTLRFTTVYQDFPRGLCDALCCARTAIGDEAFAVILPDAFVMAHRPVLAQLIDIYRHRPGSYVATQPVASSDTLRFGMLQVAPVETDPRAHQLFRVLSLVEKPHHENAPSCYGVFGRYLLHPAIFDFLDHAQRHEGREAQLTDALTRYCRHLPLYALCFEGQHYDAGDKLGYLRAVIDSALRDPEVGPDLRGYLRTSTKTCEMEDATASSWRSR